MNKKHRIKPLSNILIYFKAAVSFLIFVISSQLFTLLIIIPLPSRQSKMKKLFQRLLRWYAGFIVKTHLNIRLHKVNLNKKVFNEPLIIMVNHLSFIDVPLSLMLTHKICVITNDWLDRSPFRFMIKKYVRFLSVKDGIESLYDRLKAENESGFSVLIFPEGIRNTGERIGRFHKGGFFIAREMKLPVLPVLIYGSSQVNRRKWFYLKNGTVVIKFMDIIRPDDDAYGKTYQELTKNVAALMRLEYDKTAGEFSY